MPIKIFTTIDGPCPFRKGCKIDSLECRKCENYYRQGTGTFFWCKAETPQAPKKRGRPSKGTRPPKVSFKRRGSTAKKGKERPIEAIKQEIK